MNANDNEKSIALLLNWQRAFVRADGQVPCAREHVWCICMWWVPWGLYPMNTVCVVRAKFTGFRVFDGFRAEQRLEVGLAV